MRADERTGGRGHAEIDNGPLRIFLQKIDPPPPLTDRCFPEVSRPSADPKQATPVVLRLIP